jgi:hypothetical protein
MNRFALVVLYSVTVAALAAQQQAPTFEVVSIKRSPPAAPPGRAGLQPGNRYEMTNGPVRILINVAYPSVGSEIANAPDWVMRESYDVTAVARPNASWEAAIEAGNLSRPLPPPPTGAVPPCTARFTAGSIEAVGFSMDALAQNLARATGRVVIDKTGLDGDYDFRLDYAPEPLSASGANDRPSIFAAVQDQLGLKLEPAMAAMPVVVIEHIERPTPD